MLATRSSEDDRYQPKNSTVEGEPTQAAFPDDSDHPFAGEQAGNKSCNKTDGQGKNAYPFHPGKADIINVFSIGTDDGD